MSISKSFKYNSKTKYIPGGVFNKKVVNIIKQSIVITSDGKSFNADFTDLFSKYKLPNIASEEIVQQWNTNWLLFYQNQVNFAIWCATTGCGVDYNNHLNESPLVSSLFLFHIYYQTRRILFELGIALPQDTSWNAFNNSYDRGAYERICKEFNVDPNIDWRQKLYSNGDGLGDIYISGHVAWTRTDFRHDKSSEHTKSEKLDILDLTKMTFGPEVPGDRHCDVSSCHYDPPKKVHINYLQQDDGVKDAWTTFILDTSNGFTKAGIQRINESIRTYCWAILGSQSQTRTDILGTGTAFDAQKQFLVNIEDAINSPIDLPSQITRYQNTLKYARSKVDFVYGIDLYMSPSNMELRIGTIKDYNNEIVVATDQQELGLNDNINIKPVPPKQYPELQGTKTKQTQPVQVSSIDYKKITNFAKKHSLSKEWVTRAENNPGFFNTYMKQYESKTPTVVKKITDEHEDNKKAIIVGSIAVYLFISNIFI